MCILEMEPGSLEEVGALSQQAISPGLTGHCPSL